MAGTRRKTGLGALAPEIRFLLEVVAAGLDGRRPSCEPGLDWDAVVTCARHHFLGPLIGPALVAGSGPPPGPLAELVALRRRATMGAMRRAAETARLVAGLGADGVEALALKGPALAALLYGDPYRRASRDIDLLVGVDDEPRARAALAALGYAPDAASAANALTLTRSGQPFPVELHTRLGDDERLFPCRPLRLFETAVTVTVAERAVRTPRLEAALAYAAYHGAKHHWSRLYWLADIAAAMERPEVDWAEVADLARQTGSERHLALAVQLCETLLGRPPLAELTRLPGGRAVRRVVATMPAILAPPPLSDLEAFRRAGRWRVFMNEWGLSHRPLARLALVRLRLRPTDTDRAFVALPAGLGFLHYLLRPVRVSWLSLLAMGRRFGKW